MLQKKLVLLFFFVLLSGGMLQNCSESVVESVDNGMEELILSKKATGVDSEKDKATGTVEVIWKGGDGNNPDVEPKRAFAELTALEAYDNKPARGEFIYQVMTEELVLKREIIAEVHKVAVNAPYTWIVAKVISDSKGCSGGDTPDGHSVDCPGRISGGPASGHDEGCGGDDSDGGCSGDDHTGGGESGGGCGEDHSDGSTDGGCGEDHTDGDIDGGCGEDHTDGDTDGGCSEDDHSGGSPGGNSTNPKGHSCRVEQRVFILVYDGGTPGTNGDEIAWKWFYQDSPQKPHWDNFYDWHLCLKTIIGGNLVVHDKSISADF